MGLNNNKNKQNLIRRSFGVHLTSSEIFREYIFPEIQDKLWDFRWIDLYAGEGNLILPILDSISIKERVNFFKNHIFLYDIQLEMVNKCIKNVESYGIPKKLALSNIKVRNNLESFPIFLKKDKLPIYHITNPPYLYLGYIRKHKDTHKYLKLFNNGYQDLYQIAMMNDLRNNIENLIYIIPSNFLFGASVSNKFRLDFLKHYKIIKIFIFETKLFEYTGTNICIGFFRKKLLPKSETLQFKGLKFKKRGKVLENNYVLKPEFSYRAGSEFNEFLNKNITQKPLKIKYYLLKEQVLKSKGINEIDVIDANKYQNNEYKKVILHVNDRLKEKVKSNILYVRTVDTGSYNGRVGLGIIPDDFKVHGIYVSGKTYRTHPIQIFFEPKIKLNDQKLLKYYFNFILEAFREKLDSEFLTTYKYSDADYTRKYLGLTQARKLIQTFPYRSLNEKSKIKFRDFIDKKDFNGLLEFLDASEDKSN
ncbi:MAG: SAM-dependent DNA methyltransferase [Candidatus Thorarchaeota archaeon]